MFQFKDLIFEVGNPVSVWIVTESSQNVYLCWKIMGFYALAVQ